MEELQHNAFFTNSAKLPERIKLFGTRRLITILLDDCHIWSGLLKKFYYQCDRSGKRILELHFSYMNGMF